MTAYLHELRCSGPSDCTCETVLRVSEARARVRGTWDNIRYTREVVDNVESRSAGLSHFPEQAGRLRDHEGEAS